MGQRQRIGEGKERVRAGTSMSWGRGGPWGQHEIPSLEKNSTRLY